MAKKDDVKVYDYVADKLAERGYPGLGPVTSQADVMQNKANEPGMYAMSAVANTQGQHICDTCGQVYSPVTGHACIANSQMYQPHIFQPSQTGVIGAPCIVCGGLPSGPNHIPPEGVAMPDSKQTLELTYTPAVWTERTSPDTVTYEIQNIPNDQALRIVQDILPKALELYLKKSKDYGGNVMDRFNLGQKAAIPDMARKFGKLIDAIWRDQPLEFEQPEEILMDLLGHILIILDQREQGK
jgi:hypothetical protein